MRKHTARESKKNLVKNAKALAKELKPVFRKYGVLPKHVEVVVWGSEVGEVLDLVKESVD